MSSIKKCACKRCQIFKVGRCKSGRRYRGVKKKKDVQFDIRIQRGRGLCKIIKMSSYQKGVLRTTIGEAFILILLPKKKLKRLLALIRLVLCLANQM
ncbi:hypothetical protein HHI36_004913 [Cryptolaemus montrouzieri]|uniref:Uncharacterized protein n=1 Tax=Cryptolaemus montrouzieri TaxID=559131 RepID=A0ABD2NT15_9CUCU